MSQYLVTYRFYPSLTHSRDLAYPDPAPHSRRQGEVPFKLLLLLDFQSGFARMRGIGSAADTRSPQNGLTAMCLIFNHSITKLPSYENLASPYPALYRAQEAKCSKVKFLLTHIAN